MYQTPAPAVAAAFVGRHVQIPTVCAPPIRSGISHQQIFGTASSTYPILEKSVFPLRRRKQQKRQIHCSLTRLTGDASHKVLPALATGDQWAHFWGETEVQRMGKAFEVVAVAFLGLWACYFTSFFLGVGAMSIIGASFLFYWLLAPNVTAYRRNLALRGRIAPFPGARGNHMAIFSARVASAIEEYHPITGQPVFLRMVVEDEDGRALKFRTRTRVEYARVRPGMVTEAVLVSPDERFEEIVGVSDTFVPAANVWVGEYPYLDKVIMRQLLASRDSKRRRGGGDTGKPGEGQELDTMPYREAWGERYDTSAFSATGSTSPSVRDSPGIGNLPRSFSDEEGDECEPQYEGWGSMGFSSSDSYEGENGGTGRRRWERVSGQPRSRQQRRRRSPKSMGFEGEGNAYAGRRARQEGHERGDETHAGGPYTQDAREAAIRQQGAK
ncbi:unnamed protein product [Ascophyllum nodosum]